MLPWFFYASYLDCSCDFTADATGGAMFGRSPVLASILSLASAVEALRSAMVEALAVAVGADAGFMLALSGLLAVVVGAVAVSALAVALPASPAAGDVVAGAEAAAAEAAALASTSAFNLATSTWLPAGRK